MTMIQNMLYMQMKNQQWYDDLFLLMGGIALIVIGITALYVVWTTGHRT
jgi:hypothetical protein